jgi:hypothetical protein
VVRRKQAWTGRLKLVAPRKYGPEDDPGPHNAEYCQLEVNPVKVPHLGIGEIKKQTGDPQGKDIESNH